MAHVPQDASDDRPEWLPVGAELVATASDIVSGRRFHVWYDKDAAPLRQGLARRPQTLPYVIEDVTTRRVAARLSGWVAVVAWHDATVISPGWRVVDFSPVDMPDSDAPEGSDSGRKRSNERLPLRRRRG